MRWQERARIKVEAFEPYLGWTTLPEEVHTLLLRAQRAPQSLSKRDLLEINPEQLTLLLKVLPSHTEEIRSIPFEFPSDTQRHSLPQCLSDLNQRSYCNTRADVL